jgi:hypothetical protein
MMERRGSGFFIGLPMRPHPFPHHPQFFILNFKLIPPLPSPAPKRALHTSPMRSVGKRHQKIPTSFSDAVGHAAAF